MNFSHRMIKVFCESLTMSGNLDFPHMNMENNSGLRVSIRKNRNHLGQPKGMIVVAATSIWLPLHYMKVFEFFTDDRRRAQVRTINKLARLINLLFHCTKNNFYWLIS